jgi:hypothetical protein
MHENGNPLLERVPVTMVPGLASVLERVLDDEWLVMFTSDHKPAAVVASRTLLLRLLETYCLHVDVIPEPDGSFTLAVRELNIAEDGATLLQARQNLLDAVRSYVRHYFDMRALYRQIPEMRDQEPYVVRLSLAETDNELLHMLFPSPTSRREEVASKANA